jgi:hypothetical protein
MLSQDQEIPLKLSYAIKWPVRDVSIDSRLVGRLLRLIYIPARPVAKLCEGSPGSDLFPRKAIERDQYDFEAIDSGKALRAGTGKRGKLIFR